MCDRARREGHVGVLKQHKEKRFKGLNKQPSSGEVGNDYLLVETVSLLAQAHRGDHRQVGHGVVQVRGPQSVSSERQGDGHSRRSSGRSAKLHSTAEGRKFFHKETDGRKDGFEGKDSKMTEFIKD